MDKEQLPCPRLLCQFQTSIQPSLSLSPLHCASRVLQLCCSHFSHSSLHFFKVQVNLS
ncbi:hypothetical protein Ahy_A08g041279 isoform A [Arachis hypogaea]|uniref:Uncharacterized protein n=1 Tax=Arachis hypogaea TaxID=3818 RepID=A0A445C273_ARAHY|nr:hypothetical protein Ahy_A08g041279 isoform A [Arachis hypogaea]